MKNIKHILAIFIAVGFLILVLFALDEAGKYVKAEKEKKEVKTVKSPSPVSVITVPIADTRASVHLYAEVKPRWTTIIKAKSHGEILSISNNLEVGKKVKKGELLFSFDNHRYQTQLAEVKNQIAQAELQLYAEKQKATLARSDWKLSRRKGQPSAFALRIPQIKAAQAQLNLAKIRFNEIRAAGAYSKIVAPYNGVVISRLVSLGDVIESGQQLAQINSADDLNLTLKLNQQQWMMLGSKWQGQQVNVYPANESAKVKRSWSAIVQRQGANIDPKTRQRQLHLTLNSTDKPFAGSFVRVAIKGKALAETLKIPQGALSPEGKIWFVDKDNKLRRFKADILFSKGEEVFVKTPDKITVSPVSIVISPLSSYLPGIEVLPKLQAN